MKLLLTAKQRGLTNALAPVARELLQRGHALTLYATGNESEAAGFQGLEYQSIDPAPELFPQLVENYDAVVVGLSGYTTPDGHFLRAANAKGIPTVAVLDQNYGYPERFGSLPTDLPSRVAVMTDDCIKTARLELGDVLGDALAERSRVVGWSAYDQLAAVREAYTHEQRVALRERLGVNASVPFLVYLSQNVHPDTDYMKPVNWDFKRKSDFFAYEMELTRKVLDELARLGAFVLVKPHPGEKHSTNFTEKLTMEYENVRYLPAESCKTQDLVLTANGIIAGRSGVLAEACLLDRNIGAALPGISVEERNAFLPVALNAIPSTSTWLGVPDLVQTVVSAHTDLDLNQRLATDRKLFSVDGKAAARVADLVEEVVRR